MRIIGVTGGVGSGKTALLDWIEGSYNCKIIKADEVAHLVKEPGGPCYHRIIDLLGQQVLDNENRISRAKMAEIIFADEKILAKINSVIHPAVKEHIYAEVKRQKEKKQIKLLFIEAALLIEDGYDKIVDELWYIYADEPTRKKRLQEMRGYPVEKASKIIASQLPDEEFRARCQVVINNNRDDGTKAAIKQVEGLLSEYC
ncbi:MAG: dephospho-CoA kinase [Lachnospiraceae bacterium]|nr:dephospho-CoA kinase [Lachnospiraceae bacterium]